MELNNVFFFREREEKIIRNLKDLQREKEIEEEMREYKKSEKRNREMEEAYQDRLINWELREKRKFKEYEKIRLKDELKQEEREKEAKRLKEFLEDYDDERDDIKYYKYVIVCLYFNRNIHFYNGFHLFLTIKGEEKCNVV